MFIRKCFLAMLMARASVACFSQDANTFVQIDKDLDKISYEDRKDPYFEKSRVFFFQKNYDSALVYTNKYINGKSKKSKLNNYCLFFRGVSFLKKGLFSEARQSLKKIPPAFSLYPLVTIKLGAIELSEKNYKKALTHFDAVINSAAITKFNLNEGVIYHNAGDCYLHLENYDKAEIYLFKSLNYQETKKGTSHIVGAYLDLGNLYYTQYKDSLAIPFFIKGYELSKLTRDFEVKSNAAYNMSVVEANLGNFEGALQYRSEYEEWKDSLNDQQKIWTIAEAEKKFVAEQGRKEVLLLEKDNRINKTQRDGFIYSSILLLILFATGIYFYRQKLKANRVIAAQKKEVDALNEIKNQIFSTVSHDLRSSVNAFKLNNSSLLKKVDTGNYDDLAELLASNGAIANGTYGLLDNLLNWALLQTEQLYFYKETHQVQKVLNHVAYNFIPIVKDKGIQFEINSSASDRIYADLDSVKIVLRNLLDNALKFTSPGGHISISSHSTADTCSITIEDDGIGLSAEDLNELQENSAVVSKKNGQETIGTGLGIQLCKSMLSKNDGTLQIESNKDEWTKFTIHIPSKPADEKH
jgi:signal transduction histidine kinase